jgi:uncharacterized DUF497 family protein
MKFEFNEAKSNANKLKHGIDFVEAQSLWTDDHRLEVPARVTDEARCVVLAKVRNKIWAAVITYRSDKIRIISVRRARKREISLYENNRL